MKHFYTSHVDIKPYLSINEGSTGFCIGVAILKNNKNK